MISSSPRSSRGSHRMTLRSRCDGSACEQSSDASLDASYPGQKYTSLQSTSTPVHSHSYHHHHHHHHLHHHNHHNSSSGTSHGILDVLRAQDPPLASVSPKPFVRLTKNQAVIPERSVASRARRVATSALNRLTTVTQSIFTEETIVRSSRKTTTGHSDYSSADEELAVELNGSRTSDFRQLNGGSTVAGSTQLNTNLAMSDTSDEEVSATRNQHGTRLAFGAGLNSVAQSARTCAFDKRWSRTSTVNVNSSKNGEPSFRGQWPSPTETRTLRTPLYGLDEDEVDEQIDVEKIDSRGHPRYYYHQQQSWIRLLLLSRLSSAWWAFWYFVYWVIGNAMLLDTLFVIRCREYLYGRRPIAWKYIIPLLLLFFLLGGGFLWSADENRARNSAIQYVASLPYLSFSYLYGFLNFSSAAHEKTGILIETEAPLTWTWLDRGNFTNMLRQMVLQIYGHQAESRAPFDEARLNAMVQDAVERRIAELSHLAPGASQSTGDGGAVLEAEFAKLKEQVEANQLNSGQYQSDYQAIKAQMNQYHHTVSLKTQESSQRIVKLEHQLLELQEKLLLQDHRHNLLLANMRNCCRNHSEYAAFVKDHVVMALNGLPDAPGAETCERLAPFQKWLQSYFTTKEDLHQHMSFMADAAKNKEPDDERVSRLLLANKAMIAAIVEEQLRARLAAAPTVRTSIDLDGSWNDERFKELIHQQIALYNADRLGLPDFALESSGGSVVSTRCSESYHLKTAQYSILGIGLWYVSNSPRTVIQPGVNPGECWAFKGAQGYIVIKLSRRIKITGFSLEHIPKNISPSGSIDTAPKEFQVLGLEDETTPGVELGKYVYDQQGEPLQYFIVKDPAEPPIFQMVELRILSNHGNLDYTCLYRFRVHGDLPQP